MNLRQKSVGKIIPFSAFDGGLFCLVALGLGLGLSGCGTSGGGGSSEVRPSLDEEISLKADRSSLDELRKDIPPEKQVENDEKALLLELMGQLKMHPSEVRTKWGDLVRKKREAHRKNVQKWRDEFNKNETKARNEFLEKAKSERDGFRKQKVDRDRTRDFYAEQDRVRRDFFADERDKRKDFESQVTAQSKEFDSYMRERDKEFNEQHRLYSKQWADREKEKREAEQLKRQQQQQQKKPVPPGAAAGPTPADSQLAKDLEEMKGVQGSPLGTDTPPGDGK